MRPPAIAPPRWRRTSATASACGASCGSLRAARRGSSPPGCATTRRSNRRSRCRPKHVAPACAPHWSRCRGRSRSSAAAANWRHSSASGRRHGPGRAESWCSTVRRASEVAPHRGAGRSRVRDGARVALGAGIELEAAAPLAPWAELLDTLRRDPPRTMRWSADLARLVPAWVSATLPGEARRRSSTACGCTRRSCPRWPMRRRPRRCCSCSRTPTWPTGPRSRCSPTSAGACTTWRHC